MKRNDLFKKEIREYVKVIIPLLLDDYGSFQSEEKLNFLTNFNPVTDIIFEEGDKHAKPGNWDLINNQLHLAPSLLITNEYLAIDRTKEISFDLGAFEQKLVNSANEIFYASELENYIIMKNFNYFDLTKGIIIHEIFHALINLRIKDEPFNIGEHPYYGMCGSFMDEGMVELYARMFADKHHLFIIPSVPYQTNVKIANEILLKLGSNSHQIIFNRNYHDVLNYLHDEKFNARYFLNERDYIIKFLKTKINKRRK